jgi:hypothetical protein
MQIGALQKAIADVVGTLAALLVHRRLKSRRENGPPVR